MQKIYDFNDLENISLIKKEHNYRNYVFDKNISKLNEKPKNESIKFSQIEKVNILSKNTN